MKGFFQVRDYVLSVLFCLLSLSAYGQGTHGTLEQAISCGWYPLYKGVYIDPYPNYFFWICDKTQSIEHANIRVQFKADILIDTLTNKIDHDEIRVLIGRHNILSHGFNFWCKAMNQTHLWTKGANAQPDSTYHIPDDAKYLINWFVYRDLDKGTIDNYHTLPLRKNFAIEYSEHQPSFDWKISNETQSILSYECQKAETNYGGRNWTVWFTPEIPVDCGLWKFAGLPGLILKAEDSGGFYRFTCLSVTKTDANIEKYTSIKVKTMDIGTFKHYEKEAFRAPLQNSNVFTGGYMIGSHLSAAIDRDDDSTIYTTETYSNTYFPMELE